MQNPETKHVTMTYGMSTQTECGLSLGYTHGPVWQLLPRGLSQSLISTDHVLKSLSVYIYMYINIYIYKYTHIYIYISNFEYESCFMFILLDQPVGFAALFLFLFVGRVVRFLVRFPRPRPSGGSKLQLRSSKFGPMEFWTISMFYK